MARTRFFYRISMVKNAILPMSRRSFGSGMHSTAKVGFQKVGDQYERGRPSYPREVTDYYLKDIISKDVSNGDTILDVGAGTGIFTEILHSAFPSTDIIAVEPTESFRDIMHRKFKDISRISIRDGMADDVPFIPSDSVFAIFCGQCFHWFASMETLKEFERILVKHNGVRSHLLLIWNVANYNETPFLQQLRDDVVHLYHGDQGIDHCKFEPKRKEIEGMFSESNLRNNGLRFKSAAYDFRANTHRQSGGVDMIIDRVLSNSVFGTKSDEERERIASRIVDIARDHYGADTDNIYIPYSTYVLHTYIE